MNLRLEKDRITLRVSQEEAQILLGGATLVEVFPFPSTSGPFKIQVEAKEGDFTFEYFNLQVHVTVPQTLLQAKCTTISKEPVCKLLKDIYNHPTEIIFEIDAFKNRKVVS